MARVTAQASRVNGTHTRTRKVPTVPAATPEKPHPDRIALRGVVVEWLVKARYLVGELSEMADRLTAASANPENPLAEFLDGEKLHRLGIHLGYAETTLMDIRPPIGAELPNPFALLDLDD